MNQAPKAPPKDKPPVRGVYTAPEAAWNSPTRAAATLSNRRLRPDFSGDTDSMPLFISCVQLVVIWWISCYLMPNFGFTRSRDSKLSSDGFLLAVNPPIGQALTSDTLERCISTLYVIEAVSRAGIPAKVELIGVAL